MIVECQAKNSGGTIAIETDRVVIKGRFWKPILYSSCHGQQAVEAELTVELDPNADEPVLNIVLTGVDRYPIMTNMEEEPT